MQAATQDFDDIVTLKATVAPAGGARVCSSSGQQLRRERDLQRRHESRDATVPGGACCGSYSLEADFTSTNPLFLNSRARFQRD